MVNRNYLPFKSARNYVDRGMAKWMGFFISEHTSALFHMDDVVDVSDQMSNCEIAVVINQSYVNALDVMIYTKLRQKPYIGKIKEIFDNFVYLCGYDSLNIYFCDIVKIVLLEEL